jgi:N-acetylglucosaminyldiphosphoundecaprenol N-acetyl-beta-D-mannosaminyltransferase
MKKYINKLNLINQESKSLNNLLDKNNKKFKHFIFYNTHSYIVTLKNSTFMKSVLNSKTVFADGIGVFLASKIFNKKNKTQRITGYDFFEKILHTINEKHQNKRIFFIGGEISNLNKLKEKVYTTYNNIDKKNIEVFSPPFAKDFVYIDKKTHDLINSFDPDIIFVGLGAPKQEIWVYKNAKFIKCRNFVSIGAAFNFFTGLEVRAPLLLRQHGLEWLFRLILNPKKIFKRVFVSGGLFIYLLLTSLILKNHYYRLGAKKINVKLIKDFNSFEWDKGYILSALNLASLSFLYKGDIKITRRIFFWGDGIFHRLMIKNSKKTAGRELINVLRYPSQVDTIHVIGNLTKKTNEFLKLKFEKLKIKNSDLPYGNIDKICNVLPNVKENELIFLTLPTPKQEQVAQYYHKTNENTKIVCIGGGLAIAAGDENVVPKFFDYLGLEWLWRLRYETTRRLKRLILSATYMLKYLLFGRYLKKILVKFL